MSLSAAEITLLVGEARRVICPARLDQVYQLSPKEVVWKFRTPLGQRFLLFSAHPSRSRLHLLAKAPVPPETPPEFARSLRSHLSGAILVDIEQVGGDRIVRLLFERGTRRLTFVAELMGRGSHLLLVDERGQVLSILRPYRGSKRILVPGLPYVSPEAPAQPRSSPVRPFLTGERGPSLQAEAHYREEEGKAGLEERVGDLRKGLRKAQKKARSAVRKMEASLKEAAEAGRWQRMGEALKASLSSVRKGMEIAHVPDPWAGEGPKLAIPLEPSRTPVENMGALFRKARKLKRGHKEIEKRLAWARAELKEIEGLLEAMETASQTVTGIEKQARGRGWLSRTPRSKRKTPRRQGHRRFFSRDGLEIWVGRSDRENEEMTFRLARGDDLFLHVDGQPGSHVIVRLGRGKEMPQETLLDAAELAAHFSSAREQPKVEVIYTPRKHVRSGKRGGKGQVTIARERKILLRRDPDRLKRVLGSVQRQEEVLS